MTKVNESIQEFMGSMHPQIKLRSDSDMNKQACLVDMLRAIEYATWRSRDFHKANFRKMVDLIRRTNLVESNSSLIEIEALEGKKQKLDQLTSSLVDDTSSGSIDETMPAAMYSFLVLLLIAVYSFIFCHATFVLLAIHS